MRFLVDNSLSPRLAKDRKVIAETFEHHVGPLGR